jgi:hypothetical protein
LNIQRVSGTTYCVFSSSKSPYTMNHVFSAAKFQRRTFNRAATRFFRI